MNQLGGAQKRCTQRPLTHALASRPEKGPDGKLSPRTAGATAAVCHEDPETTDSVCGNQRLLCVETSPPFHTSPSQLAGAKRKPANASAFPGEWESGHQQGNAVVQPQMSFSAVLKSLSSSPVACGKNKGTKLSFFDFFKKGHFSCTRSSHMVFPFLPSIFFKDHMILKAKAGCRMRTFSEASVVAALHIYLLLLRLL